MPKIQNLKRHKCCVCGRVRNEIWRRTNTTEMKPLLDHRGNERKTRYGHTIWHCTEYNCRKEIEKNAHRYIY